MSDKVTLATLRKRAEWLHEDAVVDEYRLQDVWHAILYVNHVRFVVEAASKQKARKAMLAVLNGLLNGKPNEAGPFTGNAS
jgi:pyoverdine/dityrosine biosynthesis protein Dit1